MRAVRRMLLFTIDQALHIPSQEIRSQLPGEGDSGYRVASEASYWFVYARNVRLSQSLERCEF